jgi:hypothetical protein
VTALRAPEAVADAAVEAKERRQGARLTLSYRGLARSWAKVLLPERDEELAAAILAALDGLEPAGAGGRAARPAVTGAVLARWLAGIPAVGSGG